MRQRKDSMRKRLIIFAAVMAVILTFCIAGCALVGNSSDSLVTDRSSSGTTNSGTIAKADYSSMTKSELEDVLTKYIDICEKLSVQVEGLKQVVAEAVADNETNIGVYASTLVDSVMNLTCVESQYNVGCQGTGFIITEDGYVLTNNHVVEYSATVIDPSTIRNYGLFTQYGYKNVSGVYSSITAAFDKESKYFANGTIYNLQFVYRDPDYDLALLKIVEAVPVGEEWSAIPFYSGSVKRGDEVLVLGNADGFGLSATAGIVSATGKTFTDSPKLTFIQTDAAINGGNSGGPAINIYGGLIGVVNSKFVSTNIENMGFAIELDKVKTFISDAVADQTAKGSSIFVNYKEIGSSGTITTDTPPVDTPEEEAETQQQAA